MSSTDSKSYQLRVRITSEERDLLEQLRLERNKGETLSDLVREAISLLVRADSGEKRSTLNPKTKAQVEQLAVLLKRQPQQVEEACIDGILDLIEFKCEVPLIVMETHLHLKYRNKEEKKEGLSWTGSGAGPKPALSDEPVNKS
jgi:hypothetical protein